MSEAKAAVEAEARLERARAAVEALGFDVHTARMFYLRHLGHRRPPAFASFLRRWEACREYVEAEREVKS